MLRCLPATNTYSTMQSEFDQVPVSNGFSSEHLSFMMADLPPFLIHPSQSFTHLDTSLMVFSRQPSVFDEDDFSESLMGLQAEGNPHSSNATHISPALVAFPFHTPSTSPPTTVLSATCGSQLFSVGDSNTANFLNVPHNTGEALLKAEMVPAITTRGSRLPLIDIPVAPRPDSQVSINAPIIAVTPRATKQQQHARKVDPRVPWAPAARKTKEPRAGTTQPSSNNPHEANKQARIDWTTWTETITHFYLVENHTAKEVSFEMWALYGEQVAPRTLSGRFVKNQRSEDEIEPKKRVRAASSLNHAKEALSVFLFTANKRLIAKLRQARISPRPSGEMEPYACQHAMLHAIDCLVKKSFDTSRSNAAATLTAEGCSPSWQLVSDKCDGLVAVISGQAPLGSKILFLLGQLRQALDRAVSTAHHDPGFPIMIWRTCMTLLSVRFPGRTSTNRSTFLRVFLHWLRSSFRATLKSPADNLLTLVECLIRVMNSSEPYHFIATLGMGCGKTMDMVAGMVGHAHPVLLTMGTSCARYWKRDFSINRNQFERQYKPLVDRVVKSLRPTRADIAALHAYTQIQVDSKAESTAWYAAHLRIHTLDSCRTTLERRSLRYGQAARGLAFSSELLVVCQLDPVMGKADGGFDRNKFGDALQAVTETIEVLRKGNLDCLVSAAHLSKRLSIWYKSYYPGDTIKSKSHRLKGPHTTDERKRTAAIMAQIGEPPVALPKFRDPKHRPNTRWRRKRQADHQFVLSETGMEGRIQDANSVDYKTSSPGDERRQKKTKTPIQVEAEQVPWVRRRCWHCTETFPSRTALFRHTKNGCAERHPWTMD
ncbi:hypothetical protein F5144DRAFT_619366 [Chaetomium tenue]|uniref:Uncharacterized protein n=1 Tax=Chaetomium tenue TaxID=1854479 RepID=A0ACB7PC33_9PEZI|nr:hypothetical protein F5144DRAFT_619366 [Chaetomium globosum]